MKSDFVLGEYCNHPQYGRRVITEIIELGSLYGGGYAIVVDGRFSDFEYMFSK